MFNLPSWRKKVSIEPITSLTGFLPQADLPFLLSRMRDEFDRLLDRFSGLFSCRGEGAEDGWRWAVDIQDQEDAIVVLAEAPGFEAADFDLQVNRNQLHLRAARSKETPVKEGQASSVHKEVCHQAVTLPPGIDEGKIEATYHNGILTVTMPKTAEGKARKISIIGD